MKTNGYCSFNHLISLPTKDGRQAPLFDFQAFIFDIIEQNQYVWIRKSIGIGLTTFMLRYLAWKSCHQPSWIINVYTLFQVLVINRPKK
jgi:hypothetical protein